MNINKFYNVKSLVIFQTILIIFLGGLYSTQASTKYIILEESALGVIPRNIISKKYDLEEELKSFVQVYLFKRYNFTPENVEFQIEDSFSLSSKRVEEAIKKNNQDNGLFKQIKDEKLSQVFTPKDIQYGRSKDTLEVKAIGERIITHGSKIESRDNVKLSFLVRMKERDQVNPYKFYVDGVQEEIIK